jgi:hypothetical protein
MRRNERTVDADPPIGVAVAETVASDVGADALSLPPLAETIDPEALDDLVAGPTDHETTVQFEYQDREVTVHGDGEVVVEPSTPESDERGEDDRPRTADADRTATAAGPTDPEFSGGDESSVDLDD